MDSWSIYDSLKLGIVSFKAYPGARTGEGHITETIKKIVEDDFWTAIEVGTIKDVKERHEVRKLLDASHMYVAYATQPKVFGNKLNLNALDKKERAVAVSSVKSAVEEAFHLGAEVVRLVSGKDPGAEKREDAKKLLVDSFAEIMEFAAELGEINFTLKIFDRDIDKKALIGHFSDAADIAKELCPRYSNFGLLSDMSHFPLLDEEPKEALEKIKQYPLDFHIGNCVMRDRLHPAWGDLQPRFGIPGGEQDTDELRAYFQLLKDMKLMGGGKKPFCSVEVRPLLAEEYSELIIANAKRTIKEAWAGVR